MTDPKDDEFPHADLNVAFGDGTDICAAHRVAMWFDTFNSFSNGPRVEACAAAQLVHGFIPSIYKGPRP